MLRKRGSLILCGAFLFVAWNALLLLFLWGRPPIGRLGEGGGAEPGGSEEWGMGKGKGGGSNLAGEVIRLAEEVENELETQKKLLKQIQSHRSLWEQQKEIGNRGPEQPEQDEKQGVQQPPQKPNSADHQNQNLQPHKPPHPAASPHPNHKPPNGKAQNNQLPVKNDGDPTTSNPQPVIPILVIACDRVTVRRSLDKLIQYRPSPELHPIIVSQDCGHAETARVIDSYGSQVMHISQPDLSDIAVRPEHRKFQGYYKIARHYHWALNQVFNRLGYSAVVIVEDDLEVSSSL